MTADDRKYRFWQQGLHFHCDTCDEVFLSVARGWAPEERPRHTYDFREHTSHDVTQHHGADSGSCDDQERAQLIELWWERYHLHVSVTVEVLNHPNSPNALAQIWRLLQIGEAHGSELIGLEQTLSFNLNKLQHSEA